MLTKIVFKRKVRRLNRCLSITLPIDLVRAGNVKIGQELDLTVIIDMPEDNLKPMSIEKLKEKIKETSIIAE